MKDETITAFTALAKELHLPLSVSSEKLEIDSEHYTLRVVEKIDRMEGVFVTIIKKSESPKRQYALSFFVDYGGGSPAEVQAAAGKDLVEICALVKQYAARYLFGETADFAGLKAFAKKWVQEHVPSAYNFKTTKLLRAEWVDEE